MQESIKKFWIEGLRANNLNEDVECYEIFSFGIGEQMATELLDLVLSGQKRATSSLMELYQTNLPKVGDLSLVTDYNGNPKCIIRTTNLVIMPFKQMTFDLCRLEGEDDNLYSWREGHTRFFTKEAKINNITFNDDTLIIFEEFEVIFPK